MINKPNIPELCKDEIHDFILELVQKELNSIPAGYLCRKRDLCESILRCNKVAGYREEIKQDVDDIIRNWGPKAHQITHLESIGFKVTKGKKHYKIKWEGCPYNIVIAASASDQRAAHNTASDANRTFF